MLEILIILLLLLANGVFAMSEIAVVSARKARLQQAADEGDPGAAAALALAGDPTRFLSTAQIGITLVGIISGAFGGATLSAPLAHRLESVPYVGPYSQTVSFVLVVAVISYLSLVIGELVPKRIGLMDPERIASAVARPMQLLSVASAPLVALLTGSTDLILRLAGVRPSQDPPVTEEEIRVMVEQGTEAGVFERPEQALIERVLRLGDLDVASLMTPRPDISWLDIQAGEGENQRRIAASPHSRFPIISEHPEDVVGIVRARDLLARAYAGLPFDLNCCLIPPTFIPETSSAYRLLEAFKASGSHLALAVDEYGSVQGLVTATDVLEALVGYLPVLGEQAEAGVVQRPDGSLLMDGLLNVDMVKNALGVRGLPFEETGGYQTLGGFVMSQLGRIPQPGDSFIWNEYRFEVLDMDGHRVDKVLVEPAAAGEESETDSG